MKDIKSVELAKEITSICKTTMKKAGAGEKVKTAVLQVVMSALIVGFGGGGQINRGNFWDEQQR